MYQPQYIATTLFEGNYDYGVGALLNSLVSSGFKGLYCVGYKGKLPFWTNQLKLIDDKEIIFQVTDNVFIRFDLLDNVCMHFGYYKPYYLKSMFDIYPHAKGYYYFDPDIVVLAKWSFFEKWLESGISLCQDSNYTLVHSNHPWRTKWKKDFYEFICSGRSDNLNFYINSGFIGVNLHNFEIIDNWIKINNKYIDCGYPIDYFDQSNSLSAYKGDQDVLNATMTIYSHLNFSILGKEGMAFDFPHSVMAHAVDANGIKPWKRRYIKHAIEGKPASVADQFYLNYCSQPIEIYSKNNLMMRFFLLKLSKILTRLWGK